jgi:DNA modification methylase
MLLLNGDCLSVMKMFPDNSVDSIVTDPPYGLSFMGRKWDYDVPAVEVWAECLRVLKPGGHLLAFAGTRTQHRMACRIEDGGFEIRDMIAWVYGSGFPKSHNGEWGGTALKPALEPITMARKPLVGTVEANWREHGTGALSIEVCRVEPTGESRERIGEASQDRRYTESGGTDFSATPGIRGGAPAGRWPANLLHDGSPEVVALFPAKAGAASPVKGSEDSRPARNTYGEYGRVAGVFHADAGSAARFFYCAKASKADRGDNTHPTVKPTDLMRYLCRLVTPPGGIILDPFMGSGSTGKAARLEGFDFIGIERDPDYFKIAEARCA